MRHSKIARDVLIAGAFAWLALSSAASQLLASPPANLAQLRQIADGYKANKSRFTSGKCRFSFSIYSADSEQAAVEGSRNDRQAPRSMEYTLYFLDDMLSVAPAAYRTAENMPSRDEDAEVSPVNVVKKGDYAIDYDGGSAIVYGPSNSRLNVRYHPFNLASDASGVDPASLIEYSIAHDFVNMTHIVEEGIERDGRKYLLFKRSSAEDSNDMQFYIDPNRGYLPFFTEAFDKPQGSLSYRMLLLDIREEGDAYFPLHAMMILFRSVPTEKPYVEVREMRVLELDLAYKPTDEDLTIYFPRRTQYADGVNPNTAKTLFGRSATDLAPVSVHDVERISEFLQRLAIARQAKDGEGESRIEAEIASAFNLPERRRAGSAKPAESLKPADPVTPEPPGKTRLMVGANVVAVIIVAAAYLIYRRRNASS